VKRENAHKRRKKREPLFAWGRRGREEKQRRWVEKNKIIDQEKNGFMLLSSITEVEKGRTHELIYWWTPFFC